MQATEDIENFKNSSLLGKKLVRKDLEGENEKIITNYDLRNKKTTNKLTQFSFMQK